MREWRKSLGTDGDSVAAVSVSPNLLVLGLLVSRYDCDDGTPPVDSGVRTRGPWPIPDYFYQQPTQLLLPLLRCM